MQPALLRNSRATEAPDPPDEEPRDAPRDSRRASASLALLVRLRPNGPWRYGPDDGGQNRTDTLFRSDRLFSALTSAAKQLGFQDQWLAAATAEAGPAVAFSSLFPFQGETLFVIPPATLWPPPPDMVTSPSPVFLSKVRWQAARFVPVSLVESILRRQSVLADQWAVDPESECLLRRDRPSSTPFRAVSRSGAPVDRLTKMSSAAYTTAGIEFEPGSGLWMVVRFADEAAQAEWSPRVKGLLRLLADTGFGGRRSSGWGHAHAPEFQEGIWPQILFPKLGRAQGTDNSNQHWLLSLYSPGTGEPVDWAAGVYSIVERGSPSGVRTRFVAEGSVLESGSELTGRAVDVANGKAKRPILRSGIALAVHLPEWQAPETPEQEPTRVIEEPSPEEALERRPCEAEPTPESEAVLESEPASEPEPIPEPEPVREPEPVSESEPAPESGAASEPEAVSEPEPHPPEPESTPEPETPSNEI